MTVVVNCFLRVRVFPKFGVYRVKMVAQDQACRDPPRRGPRSIQDAAARSRQPAPDAAAHPEVFPQLSDQIAKAGSASAAMLVVDTVPVMVHGNLNRFLFIRQQSIPLTKGTAEVSQITVLS